MAGLLNIVPRYLPRYGMAPDWARASRPLVVVFTLIAFAVTIIFNADVDAQGGAYATGVLILMSSAAVAVTLSVWREGARRYGYLAIALVFGYTTVVNIIERPEGIKIASFFIFSIIAVSFISRTLRSTELRVERTGSELKPPPPDSLTMPAPEPFASSPIAPTALAMSIEYRLKRERRSGWNNHHPLQRPGALRRCDPAALPNFLMSCACVASRSATTAF
jgi:hypothetical protein